MKAAVAVVIAACLACAGGAPGTPKDDPGGEWVGEYEGIVPGTESERFLVFRVVDEETGQAVAGARISQCPENWLDDDGNWAPSLAEATTDKYGLATLPQQKDPFPCHYAVSAGGYAPTEEYGTVGPFHIELSRGGETAGFVRHPNGRPAAGVRMLGKVGCAHSPNLAEAVTDTNGFFVFERVDGVDLTFHDARFFSQRYWTHIERPLRWHPPTMWMLPTAEIRGRVVKADGTAPEWAVICTYDRAPRTRADASGRFILRGAVPDAELLVFWRDGDQTKTTGSSGDDRMANGTTIIVLDADTNEQPDPIRHRVDVRVYDAKGHEIEEAGRVHLDRPSDGRRFSSADGAPYEIEVEAGRYEVSAGEQGSRYFGSPRAVEITGPTALEVTVQEHARLNIVSVQGAGAAPPQPPDVKFTVQLPDRFWGVDAHNSNYLPAHSRATLRAEVGEETYLCDIAEPIDGVREARIHLPGAKQLRFPELEGEFAAYILWDTTDVGALDLTVPGTDLEVALGSRVDTPPTLWTVAVGNRWLVVRHPKKGRAIKELDLPWEWAEPILIRDLQFQPNVQRELRVLGGAGKPVKDFWFSVRDDISPPGHGWANDDDNVNGVARSALFRDGAWVKIHGGGSAPQHAQLKGNGPYVVQLGSAKLEIDLSAYEEAEIVLIGREDRAGADTQVVLTHLEAGPHTLLIGATGFVPQIHRIELKEGETRTITPTLRKRPDAAK
ncbi:MAG: hypothetical protein V3T86_09520 [Planctomycetota bacterium]